MNAEEIFFKFCDLFRISELYLQQWHVPWFEHKILLKILFINSQFQKDCSDSIFIFISFKKLLILSSKLPEIGSVIPMKASSSRNMNKFESKMTSFHDLNTKDLETKVLKVQWLMSTLATEATLKAWTLMLDIFVRDIFKEVMAEATAFSDTLVKLVLTKAKFWN